MGVDATLPEFSEWTLTVSIFIFSREEDSFK